MMGTIVSLEEIRHILKSDMRILVGGFGISGTPLSVLDQVLHTDIENLEIVSNNLGDSGMGLHKVFMEGKIKKAIGSFFTINKEAVMAWSKGELEIELLPQGTLAEAIRCGGAGIGGFYTKTAVGTALTKDKEIREIDGQRYVFEKGIRGDVALIKAAKADRLGNLVYHTTARNFNPVMATAADFVIAEVDEIVEVGELDPEHIVTPHIYVDYVVQSTYIKEGSEYVEVK
ncbi:CoA transferase subunit A [Viridibacillus sp. FSL R5-0477]|nr:MULTISPECIES: CoA transferase subunit A [Viridibacillus]OMC85315.1 succinyl-CoA--3-ketoacid-CoA transferase [Viridibacillus sp. FSL H8-0123]OMC87407.1 succinyl-CoA--3-ketoacid-CoA transferase [Viridibacillus sp. FSL H7-0596]OMC92568.1 succinyl-CoA--3-ketoacid-CoA transferase [Viridibacillus arenosi]